MHTGEVENALLSLPYVGNAVVFPLEGVDQHERVAAVIVLKDRDEVKKRSLVQLRGDLGKHTSLMEFKRPTVIYWLSNNDIIPLTANGKVSKIMVRENTSVMAGKWIREQKYLIPRPCSIGVWEGRFDGAVVICE